MKVVARQSAVGGQVVPIHAGARMPAASSGALEARVAQLETQLAQMVKVHNAAVESLNKLSKEHAALSADHARLRVGASSLAKHFYGLAGAAKQAGIDYQPVQAPAQRTVPQPQSRAAPAAQAQPQRAAPASQQTVNAQPVATQAPSNNVWEQRENLFYEGGEGDEG